MKVYWKIPLGRALIQAMEEMELDDEMRDQIVEKYEKAIDKEFDQLQQGAGRTNSNRHKLQGTCKYYKNLYSVWNFNVSSFSINLEDNKQIKDSSCNFLTVPHSDYQMRTGTQSNRRS